MIRTFADKETERLCATGHTRRLPQDIVRRALTRLKYLDIATSAEDLREPLSNRLEPLAGDRAGQWSIRINDQWRLCFRFEDGHAFDVEIVDYHRGFVIMSIPATTNGLPPIHPGELLEEILGDRGMSQAAFARAIDVSPMRISHVIREERPVTAELALRFGRAFGQSPQFWMNLQTDYDLKIAERELKTSLRKVRALAA